MDAVILAAGQNTRLLNYVPAFHKPLLPHSITESLLRNAVRLAIAQGVERPVVVASPANAYEVSRDLAGLPMDIVIQRVPTGPGEALRLGLALNVGTPSSRVLVLLSDNTLTQDDVSAVCLDHKTAIGCRTMPIDEAERFTWYDADEYRWREKEKVPNRLAHGVPCWVGPFVGMRAKMETVLRFARPINGEYAIGPHLDDLTDKGIRVQVSSQDVGTEESYLAYVRGL